MPPFLMITINADSGNGGFLSWKGWTM